MRVSEFKRRWRDGFVEHQSDETAKHRRCEIFVEGQNVEPASPVGATSGICRSYGAWYCLGIDFYKDVTPTAFGIAARLLLPISVTLVALVICGCGQAKHDQPQNESSNSPAEKLITFDTPKDWILQNHLVNSNSESFQFLIPDSATDGTPDSANAGISIEPIRDGMDITKFANSRLQSTPEPYGYVVLTNIFASDKWSSAMTRGQQNETPYLIMDRFGVDQGVMVFFRVAQPILTNNPTAVALSISNFNAVVRSLKIGGSNAVNSEMRNDYGTIWLRALSDLDTNWMVSPSNKPVYRSQLPRK